MSTPEVIDSNAFDSFPDDALDMMKASNSSTATESVSSADNMQPGTPQRSPNRLPPDSPHRSPMVSHGSPHRSPIVNNSPLAHGSPSDRGMVHTRTNFGKTRGYVPPMVPSSPGRMPVDPPVIPRSPHRNTLPFEDEDAPDDEAQFRTVRSLRPKPAGQYHSDGSANKGSRRSGRLHRRHNSATQDVTAPPSPARPEAYISETDDSSMGQHDLSFEPKIHRAPSPARAQQGQDARQPSPDEPFDAPLMRYQGQEARHPSPIESIQTSPIRPSAQDAPESPRQRNAEELGELRRRRRRNKNKKPQQQYEMPAPEVDAAPPMRVTSTKTSDLTEDTELDPMPSFDNSVGKRVDESEMEYHEEGDTLPPPESPRYEEFEKGREASVSPQKEAVKPKSILRSKCTTSQGSDIDDDDDSLFDFGGTESALGKGTSIRRSSLKNGSNSSNRRGRRPRRKADDDATEDDESLIQYGEVRQRSSSLQERTQEAWTFRSKRSFSASSPKKEGAGVQFGNTDTIHHFDDQVTVGTNGTIHSMNSLYTKSPESEAEDLIKDLLMIGSGEHSNPGRRKLKYQPEYKHQLREGADDSTVDDNTLGTNDNTLGTNDNTLGTTDVSLNTLEYTAGGKAYSEAPPSNKVIDDDDDDDDMSLETSPRKSDAISRSAQETLDSKSKTNNDEDPLAVVWDYVESGMHALGLASTPPKPKERKGKEKKSKETKSNAESTSKETPAAEEPTKDMAAAAEEALVETADDDLFVDEVKEDNKGSFGGVMDYIFGDPLQKNKQDTDKLVSSAGSVTTTSTPLEDDPRLEELALYAVRSKHQVYDLVFDESVTVDIEKDIKFSLVKMKLPLGILFHENDGGCWITKVFPDGNAAKAGGVEVGDQLAAINGISAIKLRVDQICTLITEAPNPDNIELTFLRYIGQLHPVVPDVEAEESFEQFEVTDADALMKPPIKKSQSKSLRPLSKLRSSRDPSPKPDKSLKAKHDTQKLSKGETKGRKGLGKWFGKGKKKSHAV